jgi:hypothetical protein
MGLVTSRAGAAIAKREAALAALREELEDARARADAAAELLARSRRELLGEE